VVSENDIQELIKIDGILTRVESLIHGYWGRKDTTVRRAKAPPVAPEIVLSISVLGHALAAAVMNKYRHYYTHRNWAVSAVVEDRMKGANWCPSRITQLFTDFEIDGVCYLALQPAHDLEDHASCNKIRCHAGGVGCQDISNEACCRGLHLC